MGEDVEIRLPERIAIIEATIRFHEQRLSGLEKGLNDLSHKLTEVVINQRTLLEKFNAMIPNIEAIQANMTMKGAKWFVEKILLPILVAAITAGVLKFL